MRNNKCSSTDAGSAWVGGGSAPSVDGEDVIVHLKHLLPGVSGIIFLNIIHKMMERI